jgi:hypothetical protein
MDKYETYKMCLEERQSDLKRLNESLEMIDIEICKSRVEEEMYSCLKERCSLQETFVDKYSESMAKSNDLIGKKAKIIEELTRVGKEIEYLKSKV